MTTIAARRPTFAVIDAQAIRENFALLRAAVSPAVGVLAVVKAGVQLGDEVVLWGRRQPEEIGVTEVAERQGTVSYEMLTRIGKRVGRVLPDAGR